MSCTSGPFSYVPAQGNIKQIVRTKTDATCLVGLNDAKCFLSANNRLNELIDGSEL